MDSRTRLAIGGMTTVAASVAVICVVAMTSSVALADRAGSAVDAERVIVPARSAAPAATSSPTSSAAPSTAPASAVPSPTPPAPDARSSSRTPVEAAPPSGSASPERAETVPAPAPVVVAVPPADAVPEPSVATEQHLVSVFEETGSWEPVREWGQRNGWSAERVEAWIERLEARVTAREKETSGSDELTLQKSDSQDKTTPPAGTGNPSGRDLSGSSSGSKREQSRVPPD